ncbi:MAG: hypothetical protein PVJ86_09430 [Phycisphaerales bacterium]|jgi:hypothetical protein
MILSATHKRKALWIAAWLAALLVIAGCSAIEPYEPRDNREEGPQHGLFSGAQGEWVIFRIEEKPQPDSAEENSQDETKADEVEADQPEVDQVESDQVEADER